MNNFINFPSLQLIGFNSSRISEAERSDRQIKESFKSTLSDIEAIFMDWRLTKRQFVEKIFGQPCSQDRPHLTNDELMHDARLNRDIDRIRNALRWPATGMHLFIYLAIFHKPCCLKSDGDLDIELTQKTIEKLIENISKSDVLLQYREVEKRNFLAQLEEHKAEFLNKVLSSIHFEEIEEEIYYFSFGNDKFFDEETYKIAGRILQAVVPGILPTLRKVRRIIVLAPKASEMIYKLGAGDKLVGAAKRGDEKAIYETSVKEVRQGDGFNLDLIEKLHPNLIIALPHQAEKFPKYLINRSGLFYFILPEKSDSEILCDLGKIFSIPKRESKELSRSYSKRTGAAIWHSV
jgi:hypothetical protein